MSGDLVYWSFVGIGFVLTMVFGIILMRITNRLTFSFLLSSILNIIIFAAATIWWLNRTHDSLQRMTGIAFYGIALLNVALLDFFALVSIRKSPPNPDEQSQGTM